MSDPIFIVDAHLDLSMNAMEWNRDLRKPVHTIREMESGMSDKPDRGKGMVAFPELRKGNVGLCVATLIARYVAPDNPLPGWNSQHQAWAQTQGQLSWYRAMEDAGELRSIRNLEDLEDHLQTWKFGDHRAPLGYILSLEGADSIVNLDYLHKAHAMGLRAIGPAHYGPGVYAQGTNAIGGMGAKGHELLREMESLNIILDTTHLSDESFWEAIERYNGPIWASHSNCRSIVDMQRQFSDDQIKALIEKGAVIGGVLDAWMMIPGWEKWVSTPENTGLKLEHVIDHYDHICQIAGNTDHIAIGTDMDGAFGQEQSPGDMDTIADLQMLPELLLKRGYTQEDVEKVMNKNWLNFLGKAWA